MSGCREGCDLLNKNGRYVFFRDLLKYRRFNRNVWKDTFGRVLCWLAGEHSIKQNFDNDQVKTSCVTCCKWLKQDGYKWKEKGN
jgi:hypothetical protein